MKLKDFAIINMGQSPKGETYNSEQKGAPFLQGRKTFGRLYPTIDTWTTSPIKFANKGEILMSVRAPVGDMNISTQDICIGRGLCSISAKNGRNKYLYYVLLNNMEKIKQNSTGTVFSSINKNDLENLEIDFHSDKTQKKIEKILDDIDSKIELNTEINNNLYKLCNNIFHDYLNRYEEKIEYKKINEIAKKIITGKTPSTANKDFWDGSIPFITIPDMHNRVFTIKTERNITKLGAKSIIPKNSISVSCIATVGLVSINVEDSQTNQQINSIVIENDYDLYYLFEYLSEQEEYMKSIAGGSTTYNINKNVFKNTEIPYLPKELLIEFNNNVSTMFEKIKLNQYENDELSQLRDTLLPKLMNGEIELDNIQI